jgi:hypothetical protein
MSFPIQNPKSQIQNGHGPVEPRPNLPRRPERSLPLGRRPGNISLSGGTGHIGSFRFMIADFSARERHNQISAHCFFENGTPSATKFFGGQFRQPLRLFERGLSLVCEIGQLLRISVHGFTKQIANLRRGCFDQPSLNRRFRALVGGGREEVYVDLARSRSVESLPLRQQFTDSPLMRPQVGFDRWTAHKILDGCEFAGLVFGHDPDEFDRIVWFHLQERSPSVVQFARLFWVPPRPVLRE